MKQPNGPDDTQLPETLAWLRTPAPPVDETAAARARARQAQLTKPPGSLGALERVAVHLAALQGRDEPRADPVAVGVFAADHGVVEEGISAFPQAVTQAMVANFANGGAAVCVLAQQTGAHLEVIDVGTCSDQVPEGVVDARIAPGTRNFRTEPAMARDALHAALTAGAEAVDRAQRRDARVWIGGEMGIGNTTAATALGCAVLGMRPADVAGPGTGLAADGVAHKAHVIESALTRHRLSADDPCPATPEALLEAARCVGGFEIAALTGSYLRAARHGMVVLLDGFIATAAAVLAIRLSPSTLPWLWPTHRSAEPGHDRLLECFPDPPLLDLGLRLGEGTGALAAVPLVQSACAIHNRMATFEQAGVPDRPEGDA